MKNTCCICYDPKLDALIYQSKVTLEKLSNEIVKSKSYGYSCDKSAGKKIDLLTSYLHVLEDENRKVILGGNVCLTCDTLQSLAEKVRRLTASCNIDQRKDLIKDSSSVDAWIAQNPYCVSRDRWERIAYMVCEAFHVSISSVETQCDLSFELVRKIIPCDLMVAISIFEEMCDLNLTVDRTEEECELDFSILKTEVCDKLSLDVDIKTYKQLVGYNLSYDVIRAVYENGCNFEVGDTLPETMLITPLNKYPITSLSKKIPNIEILQSLGVDVSDSEYAKDPQRFINKLKQDYR